MDKSNYYKNKPEELQEEQAFFNFYEELEKDENTRIIEKLKKLEEEEREI